MNNRLRSSWPTMPDLATMDDFRRAFPQANRQPTMGTPNDYLRQVQETLGSTYKPPQPLGSPKFIRSEFAPGGTDVNGTPHETVRFEDTEPTSIVNLLRRLRYN